MGQGRVKWMGITEFGQDLINELYHRGTPFYRKHQRKLTLSAIRDVGKGM
jgi:hypothetical protein